MKLNQLAATLVMAMGVTAAFAQAAPAAAGGDNRADPKPATGTALAVESLRTAAELVRYGDANKDPLALITAARMMKQAGVQDSKAERVAVKPEAKDKPDTRSVEAVLARAKTLANGRQDLLALADDVAAGGSRGALEGPARGVYVVAPFDTDTVRISFRAGEPARVLVSGDGDSDLDLYILDENGNQICKDDDATDDMVCGWTPRYTGQFAIRIVNRGVANRYWTIHN
jgi:hypothetical protein